MTVAVEIVNVDPRWTEAGEIVDGSLELPITISKRMLVLLQFGHGQIGLPIAVEVTGRGILGLDAGGVTHGRSNVPWRSPSRILLRSPRCHRIHSRPSRDRAYHPG